jgi:hypothetical protein
MLQPLPVSPTLAEPPSSSATFSTPLVPFTEREEDHAMLYPVMEPLEFTVAFQVVRLLQR